MGSYIYIYIKTINMKFTGERIEKKQRKFEHRFADHLERYEFAKPFIKEKIVLDVACGTGYGTHILSQVAKDISWLDVDPQTVKVAKEKYHAPNLHYFLGDGKKLPFEDNQFDTVISFETIEHIVEYEQFLKEIKRVLKGDGTLIISTPNFLGEIVKNTYHVSNFTFKDFVDTIKNHFNINEILYQGKHFYPIPWRGLLEAFLGIKKDVKIYNQKPSFEHHVTIIKATNKK